jgi:hypothetical protein
MVVLLLFPGFLPYMAYYFLICLKYFSLYSFSLFWTIDLLETTDWSINLEMLTFPSYFKELLTLPTPTYVGLKLFLARGWEAAGFSSLGSLSFRILKFFILLSS